MDWPSSRRSSPDLNAIIAYLRTFHRSERGPTRTFLPVYLWGKFKMLILGGDPPMLFYSGNAGAAQ